MQLTFIHTNRSRISLRIFRYIEIKGLQRYIKCISYDTIAEKCEARGKDVRDYLPKHVTSVPCLIISKRREYTDIYVADAAQNINSMSILDVIKKCFENIRNNPQIPRGQISSSGGTDNSPSCGGHNFSKIIDQQKSSIKPTKKQSSNGDIIELIYTNHKIKGKQPIPKKI